MAIPLPAYRADHCIFGHAVLPAVEALQILAATLPASAGVNPLIQKGAVFSHLLTLDPGPGVLPAVHEWQRWSDGRCLSRLTTVRRARSSAVTRPVEHARVWFTVAEGRGREDEAAKGTGTARALSASVSGAVPSFPRMRESRYLHEGKDSAGVYPRESGDGNDRKGLLIRGIVESEETAETPGRQESLATGATAKTDDKPGSVLFSGSPDTAGPVFAVSNQRLYEELVLFGPAYRNVTGEVCLTPAGATAGVSGGGVPEADGPLGSAFPLDAALHVACAWGQRYRGLVAFPVGFGRREVFAPTETGGAYRCSVVPLPGERPGVLRFDILLEDDARRTVEVIQAVEMRDISGGRQLPPAWVREGA